jgi:hypothetical protein
MPAIGHLEKKPGLEGLTWHDGIRIGKKLSADEGGDLSGSLRGGEREEQQQQGQAKERRHAVSLARLENSAICARSAKNSGHFCFGSEISCALAAFGLVHAIWSAARSASPHGNNSLTNRRADAHGCGGRCRF